MGKEKMKKVKYLLFAFLLSLLLIPMAFAEEKVSIESVTLVEKSDLASEEAAPKIDGLNLGFDLSFSAVEDYTKYKVGFTIFKLL